MLKTMANKKMKTTDNIISKIKNNLFKKKSNL